MAFNASVDPKLMSERRLVTMKQIPTARIGMFHPGVTVERNDEPGIPYKTN